MHTCLKKFFTIKIENYKNVNKHIYNALTKFHAISLKCMYFVSDEISAYIGCRIDPVEDAVGDSMDTEDDDKDVS